MPSEVAALESLSTLPQQRMQPGPHVTTRALEPRILKLEVATAGLFGTSVGEHIQRLERIMENERRERRARISTLQHQIQSFAEDVAVLLSENEGMRVRLNTLTGQVRTLRG
jgi:hypothetical protein